MESRHPSGAGRRPDNMGKEKQAQTAGNRRDGERQCLTGGIPQVTVHIPENLPESVRQRKINQIYDILAVHHKCG